MDWKQWLCIGAGCGAALTLGLALILRTGPSDKPKPWDEESLKAGPKVLWMYTEDSSSPPGQFAGVSLSYTIENTTNRQISFARDPTVIRRHQTDKLVELAPGLYRARSPDTIPAGASVQLTLEAPPWFLAGEEKGFVLRDIPGHYQINLPEPDGPTKRDQERSRKQLRR